MLNGALLALEVDGQYYLYNGLLSDYVPIDYQTYLYCEGVGEKTSCFERLEKDGFIFDTGHLRVWNEKTPYLKTLLSRSLNHIVLQVTRGCNLRCSYCPFSQKNDHTRHHSNEMMSEKVAIRAIDYLYEHSVDSKQISLGFYGGEPFLNFDLIKKSVLYAEKKFKGRQISFSVTSNSTLLNDEILSFLESHHFQLVVSIDGDQQSTDKNRRFPSGKGSVFKIVMEKLELISNKYPLLFKNMTLNMVMDPSLDFSEYDQLITHYPFLNSISISAGVVDETYSDQKTEKRQSFEDSLYYRHFLLYLEILENMNFSKETKYFQALKGKCFLTLMQAGSRRVKETVFPVGTCDIGHTKLFVDIAGHFLPCEKVNEKEKLYYLGDVYKGFDDEKVDQVYNYASGFGQRCSDCFALNECNMCINAFGLSGFGEGSKDVCQYNRSVAHQAIHDKIVLEKILSNHEFLMTRNSEE